MAAGDTDIGTSSTLTFAGFTAELINVDWGSIERAEHETSHMGTTNASTFVMGDLYNPGDITAEVHFKSTEKPPLNGAMATLTLTVRAGATRTDGTTWVATAGLKSFQLGVPLEGLMTATAVFKASGEITVA